MKTKTKFQRYSNIKFSLNYSQIRQCALSTGMLMYSWHEAELLLSLWSMKCDQSDSLKLHEITLWTDQ